ncbi:hypothetical protein RB653_007765 [Dictyostelium firmibasis]|uniref:Uncharacterized protein n=1 Tax=Dictyostelium firmibasis TaxID=79012 RepID=A0AAN7YRS6_9MYCE
MGRGDLCDAFETAAIIILRHLIGPNIKMEWSFLFHFVAILFKCLIFCCKSDGREYGSLSKNLCHLLTTIIQSVTQYQDNPKLFSNDMTNIFFISISIFQDIIFMKRSIVSKKPKQKEKLEDLEV